MPAAGPVISSRDNPRVKQLAALLSRKKEREGQGLFALEGVRLCLDALAAGFRPQSVLLTEEALARHPALGELVGAAESATLLDPALAARVADTEHTQGVFAVCRAPDLRRALPARPDGAYLLLDGVRDPGNLGAMLRTAAALGVDGAWLSGCAELLSPKVLRASMGGALRLPVALEPDMAGRIAALRAEGIKSFAAALREDGRPPDLLPAGPGGRALLIGNEGAGLPDRLVDACDAVVTLPMRSGMDSLNAAVAAGILLWEMTRSDSGRHTQTV